MQNINRIIDKEKDLPPGITYTNDTYVVSLDTTSKSFNTKKYGTNLALNKALEARLDFILANESFTEALLPKDLLKQHSYVDTTPQQLRDEGVNLWTIMYGGKYAPLSDAAAAVTGQLQLVEETLASVRKTMMALLELPLDDEALERLLDWKEAILKTTEIFAKKKVVITPVDQKVTVMLARVRDTLEKSKDEAVEEKCERMLANMTTRVENVVIPKPKVEKKKKEWADDPTDSVGKWMEERCDRKGRVSTTEAYEDYVAWMMGKKELVKQGTLKFNYYVMKKGIGKETKVTFNALRLK
jgi:hypothetical protein